MRVARPNVAVRQSNIPTCRRECACSWRTLPAVHGDMTRLRARRAGALVPRYLRLLREITITRSSYGGARGVTYAEDHVARTIGICRVPAGSGNRCRRRVRPSKGDDGGRRDAMGMAGTARPTRRELLGEIWDVVTDLPILLTAPLYRRWHLHWARRRPRSPRFYQVMRWYRTRSSKRPGRYRSMPHPRRSGHGWCRSGVSAPASTAMTCSTTSRTRAQPRSPLRASLQGGHTQLRTRVVFVGRSVTGLDRPTFRGHFLIALPKPAVEQIQHVSEALAR